MFSSLYLKLFASLLVLAAVSSKPMEYDSILKWEWETWKETHGKRYSYEEEEMKRSQIWLQNKRFIENHNMNGEATSYTLAMNEFGDLTEQEWRDSSLGFIPTPNDTDLNRKLFKAPTSGDYPEYLDWRTKNAVTPVKVQGQCNASYAFSVAAAIEGASAMVLSEAIPLSEQNIVDCAVPYGNHGCKGGDIYSAFQYVINNGGIETAKTYPFKEKQEQCIYRANNSGAAISGVVSIKKGSEHDLLAAVATVGPISVGVDASSNAFRFYSSGVFNSVQCSNTKLNHAMTITGYGTLNGMKFWLVKNSWGKAWGQGGYILMARDFYNQCGIATHALYPTL